MKQAYQRYYVDMGGYYHDPVELTGQCKTVTGGPFGCAGARKYFEVQRRLFGYKIGTKWVHEDEIKFFDEVVEVIHKCECLKDE